MNTDEKIYYYLLGDFKIGVNQCSPLRDDDTNASFGIYRDSKGILKWHDFGLGRKPQGKLAVHLVMEMEKLTYSQAMRFIETEIMVKPVPELKIPEKLKLNGEPELYLRDHKDFELKYWARFGQTKEDLSREHIWAVDKLILPGFQLYSTRNDPAFAYLFGKDPLSFKLYRPLTANKANKFRMFNTTGVIEGWDTLEGSVFDLIWITSSTKDRLVWKKVCGPSEGVINPRSEGIFREIIEKKDQILNMSKRIIVIFDADETGFIKSKALARELGSEFIDVRNRLGLESDDKPVKDLARLTELRGLQALQNFKNSLW